jgi:uncharacterized cupredoxin-like copper-binding protein
MRKRSVAAVAIAVGASLTLASLAVAVPRATTVTVTAGKPSELRFTLSKRTVPKAPVTFAVTNRGKLRHDFKIAGKKTPLLSGGKKATLSVTFKKAGRYPYLCTVPGHAAAGMKGTLVVK